MSGAQKMKLKDLPIENLEQVVISLKGLTGPDIEAMGIAIRYFIYPDAEEEELLSKRAGTVLDALRAAWGVK